MEAKKLLIMIKKHIRDEIEEMEGEWTEYNPSIQPRIDELKKLLKWLNGLEVIK